MRVAQVCFSVFVLSSGFLCLEGDARETEYVVLVTADGLRHQEVFGGMAPMFSEINDASGIANLDSVRARFWDEEEKKRREKLLPFFWKRLAKQGIVLGNPKRGSTVLVKNAHRFSYPGYAEILNGAPQPSVISNDPKFSPRPTVLQHIRRAFSLPPEGVATFASWAVFNWITMSEDEAVYCNAGVEAIVDDTATGDMRLVNLINALQSRVLPPWESIRHDGFTVELAMNHLRVERPRFLYLALDETDDWAHNRRYDRYLHAASVFDGALERLWNFLQSEEPYRGRTSLIVASDHGRGRTSRDWTDHGAEIDGADEIWIAVIGPDTPDVGEAADQPTVFQSQIAATILRLYGLEVSEFNREADAEIQAAFSQ